MRWPEGGAAGPGTGRRKPSPQLDYSVAPWSRRISLRTRPSGSAPMKTPRLSYTLHAGLVLCCLGAASAPDVMPTIMASAMAVLVSMVRSPVENDRAVLVRAGTIGRVRSGKCELLHIFDDFKRLGRLANGGFAAVNLRNPACPPAGSARCPDENGRRCSRRRRLRPSDRFPRAGNVG